MHRDNAAFKPFDRDSYGTINVVLFIIINPLSTILAVISAIVIAKAKHHKVVLSVL